MRRQVASTVETRYQARRARSLTVRKAVADVDARIAIQVHAPEPQILPEGLRYAFDRAWSRLQSRRHFSAFGARSDRLPMKYSTQLRTARRLATRGYRRATL